MSKGRFFEFSELNSDFRAQAADNAASGQGHGRGLDLRVTLPQSTDRVVGAHMIGPDAPEVMQMVAVAVKAGLTKTQFDECVAIHPTMAEELVLMR